MAKYHVYGIGNALVDYEFKVQDSDLAGLAIDKGLMTLVDEDRQNQILEGLHQETPVRACGGSAANTMIGVSQLSGRAFYSCKVANDESGDFYFNDLKKSGVESSLEHLDRKDGVTGKCFVLVTPDAERSMNTFLGITESFSKEEIVESSLENSEYLYMEGYLVTSPTGKAAALEAKRIADKAGVKTALTFSDPNMVEFFRDGLHEMLGEGVDLLFCNEAEAMKYAGEDSLDAAIEKIKKVAKTFTITLGSKGAYVYDGEKGIIVPGFEATAVDSNGAGDLYAGTFLYGITNGYSYEDSAKMSNYAASILVNKYGPRLDQEGVERVEKFVKGLNS